MLVCLQIDDCLCILFLMIMSILLAKLFLGSLCFYVYLSVCVLVCCYCKVVLCINSFIFVFSLILVWGCVFGSMCFVSIFYFVSLYLSLFMCMLVIFSVLLLIFGCVCVCFSRCSCKFVYMCVSCWLCVILSVHVSVFFVYEIMFVFVYIILCA